MDFKLNNSKKIEILNASIESTHQELYQTLVRLGIDPETFDANLWEEPVPVVNHEEHRVTLMLNSIKLGQQKIQELS